MAFVDQISVPFIQNVVDGRNTIYYEETILVIPNLTGDWTFTSPAAGTTMTRAFVPDPADKKHWTYAGSGTDHVYLQAGFDNVTQTMTVEVNHVM